MGKETGIPWCDKTFNPWHGCVEVSAECDRCYAREFDGRFGDSHWGKDSPRRFFGEKHWNEPIAWNRAAAKGAVGKDGRRTLVFCSSMADVFESREDLEPWRFKLWGLIKATPHLTWLLLTKRTQNIRRMLPGELVGAHNVWMGTTCGLPGSLWRAESLIENAHEAPVRFLSMEPLLERTSLVGYPTKGYSCSMLLDHIEQSGGEQIDGINWVIVGSESGDGARPMQTDWAREVIAECKNSGVPVFLKQADEGADGISAVPPLPQSTNAPYRRRDLRKGPDGMKRVHWIVERPYLDGVQHVEWPA